MLDLDHQYLQEKLHWLLLANQIKQQRIKKMVPMLVDLQITAKPKNLYNLQNGFGLEIFGKKLYS
jgi:hypothetical protein